MRGEEQDQSFAGDFMQPNTVLTSASFSRFGDAKTSSAYVCCAVAHTAFLSRFS